VGEERTPALAADPSPEPGFPPTGAPGR
jgi:hypothetical protein